MNYDPSLLPDYGGPNEELLPPLSAWDAYPEEPETIEVVEYRVVRKFTYSEGQVMSEQARRVRNYGERDPSAICYWKHEELGEWYIHFPTDDGHGLLGGLANHAVEEHEDGTISVTPSILTTGHNGQRHGYLTKGTWNEV